MFDPGVGSNGQDIPFRFLPCMVAGLAYMLSMKIPGADARTPILKAQYDEAWDLVAAVEVAGDQDQEREYLGVPGVLGSRSTPTFSRSVSS